MIPQAYVALPGRLLAFLRSSACHSSAQCLSAAVTCTGCSLHSIPACVQTQVDAEHPDEPKPAPPGAGRQLLVVMRHGQRIDEVRALLRLYRCELSVLWLLVSEFRAAASVGHVAAALPTLLPLPYFPRLGLLL